MAKPELARQGEDLIVQDRDLLFDQDIPMSGARPNQYYVFRLSSVS